MRACSSSGTLYIGPFLSPTKAKGLSPDLWLLRRGHLDAADSYLAQLRANSPLNHDIAHSTALLTIELHLRRREHSAAMDAVDAPLSGSHPTSGTSSSSAAGGGGDAYHAVQLLALKARVYDAAGVPHKGCSAGRISAGASCK